MSAQYFKIDQHINIAYKQLTGKTPGIIFCCGFMSEMRSTKAMFVEDFCREHGYNLLKFDYRGHGQSSGDPAKCSINTWLTDSLTLIDQLTEGPQIVIGSSMGAWISTLIAQARPEKIKGLLTIAAAPDFTEDLIWEKLSSEQKSVLLNNEVLYAPSQYSDKPYAISKQLIEDSRQHLVLKNPIAINCPVRLLHGLADIDVPWQKSLRLSEQLQSKDVQLTLIKDGDHRLVRKQDLYLLEAKILELLSI